MSVRAYRNAFRLSVAAFVAVSAAAGAGWLHRADLWLLRTAQIPASRGLDAVSEAFSLVGGVSVTTALVIALVAGLYLRGRRSLASRLAAAFVVATLVEMILKLYLPVPPLPIENLRSGGEDLILTLPNPYPSGHMLRGVFLAGAAVLLWPRRTVSLAAGAALAVMAATRVYLGVHWASDVVGGVLLGVAALAWAFGREASDRRKERAGWT